MDSKMSEYRWEPSPRWPPLLKFVAYITVEPTMVLYMLAFMTTTIVEQAFFVDKACRVNHNLSAAICNNITHHDALNRQVQITVSNFDLWNSVAGQGGPIILALFMGAWSDRRGRKLPLLIGLLGKLYYSAMIVVNASQPTWPLEYVIYTATLPMAATGADVAIFAAAYSYLIDVCSNENRTMRLTLLEVFYLATMPTGIALGKYLFGSVVHRSYAVMFAINSGMLVCSLVYSALRLEWRTNARQRPLGEAANVFTDFFDYEHVVNTSKTVFKRRPKDRRMYLLLSIAMMALYTFQRDEKGPSYLYLQQDPHFRWTMDSISDFRTYQSTIQDVVLLVSIPVMCRWLGWRDSVIVMIGAAAHVVGRVFYVLATSKVVFYVGGAFVAIGPIVAPVVRSMVSKMVAASEKGKTLSVLSVADNAVPIVSSAIYSKLYNATLYSSPHAFFYLTMATQLAVFGIVTFIHFRANDVDLVHIDDDEIVVINNGREES